MDEKRRRRDHDPDDAAMNRQVRRNLPPVVLLVVVSFIVFSLWRGTTGVFGPAEPAIGLRKAGGSGTQHVVKGTSKLVPLEAHMMSKCPDSRDCLRDMILPVMVQAQDKINFTLSFIGTPTENDGVDCKHGAAECMGNIVELCAAQIYREPKIWLGFTMCLTKDYHSIPERSLVEGCALEHAMDIKKLNECATRDDGAFGMSMLRDSVKRTIEAGVTRSCTVRLNEEIYCVRDDGEWINCPNGSKVEDLVSAIEELYSQS